MTLINFSIFHLESQPNQEQSISYCLEAVTILLPFLEQAPYTQQYFKVAMSVLQDWEFDVEDWFKEKGLWEE